jgi:glucose 1-dehydrogenase
VETSGNNGRQPLAQPLLTGQKALVTGANSGIGKATAIGLGRVGADVVVNYVAGREAAEEVVREIEGFGVRAYAHEADVSQEDQVVDMVSRMVEEFGTIDVMVANAGLQRDAALTDMTIDPCTAPPPDGRGSPPSAAWHSSSWPGGWPSGPISSPPR